MGSSAEHSEKWHLEPRGSVGQESRVGLVRWGAVGRLLIQASPLSLGVHDATCSANLEGPTQVSGNLNLVLASHFQAPGTFHWQIPKCLLVICHLQPCKN